MTAYLAQRFLLIIPTFVGITLIVFMIVRLAPGDPAELRAAGGLGAAAGGGISVEKRGAVDEAMAQSDGSVARSVRSR
jgi:ABC-type microcin C transport system permease subunit YejB